MLSNISFTRDNLDNYLKILAKEFKKINGPKTPAEIILVGGASVVINYGFRQMTNDIDAIIKASSAMKEAINKVGDSLNLPNGWINTDFVQTPSYTTKLIEHSKYYKTFSNILQIRTVSGEYLIAMKLMAGRKYKNDLSDIVGIVLDQNNIISLEKIKLAVENLYGDYLNLPQDSRDFIEQLYKNPDLAKLYEMIKKEEKENKEFLLEFEEDYPDVLSNGNINDIIALAKSKKNQ